MKLRNQQFIYSPSDLSNHLNCKHLTQLNKSETRGELQKPESYSNLSLQALIERGQSFEEEHLEKLKAEGHKILELEYGAPDAENRTIQAMQKGVDVIFQARLKSESWSGYADFVKKVDKPSKLGDWSYEVWDTKLATNTKASTVLQIGLYTQRIAEIQGLEPEFMGVIKPDGKEIFRYHDYAAYIRLSQRRLEAALKEDKATYPEPVSHCDICDWWKHCNARRREDDHLTFVAGMGRSQIAELRAKDIPSLGQLATQGLLSFKPDRGNINTYKKLQEQAKIQYDSRNQNNKNLHQLLPLEETQGLFLLPKPNEHDIFLDLEGARMVEPDGIEYLIGYYYQGEYHGLWANNEEEELASFQKFMSWAHSLKQEKPELHIYHYAPYETTAFKRLMGKYVTYENEVDEFLRSGTFVDLYRILKGTLIASVERYSLKDLEPFFGYERATDLREVSKPKRNFEYLLEIKRPDQAAQQDLEIIEGYNKDDCKALIKLQAWLEEIRESLISEGHTIPRPELVNGEANERITAHQQRILPLFQTLTKSLPVTLEERNAQEQASYILAHFLDWYRREKKALWWEYYRLKELDLEEILNERKAVSYLEFTGNTAPHANSIVYDYRFPPQEVDLKVGGSLKNQAGQRVGSLFHIDKESGILQIKKSAQLQSLPHPDSVIQIESVKTEVKEESIIRLAEWVDENSWTTNQENHLAARKLLQRIPPSLPERTNRDYIDYAFEVLSKMNGDYLAIQGPPGAGKSYTGSHLILRLVKAGKKVGITAMSHKVITNLLSSVYDRFRELEEEVNIVQKGGSTDSPWTTTNTNPAIDAAINSHQVIAGTSFMWAREELYQSVDYLFVDEAGQLALIDTVALAQATDNLVLLGDPNQLQQPQQGVHPTGTQVSALEHILDGQQTIPEDQGIFLGSTWRMHPSINEIVSELFYQNRLIAEEHLATQKIMGSDQFKEGLALMEVEHEGNTSSSAEEVQKVQELVTRLTQGDTRYIDGKGEGKILERSDIKIISPYNAQVHLLKEALPDLEIGTVDKFQGQEAPIVIYSVASSSPQEAPRGMDFLYSPNRLNVAISRAQALFIMVASPEIFEAECKSPKEMKLANAFCRYREASNFGHSLLSVNF